MLASQKYACTHVFIHTRYTYITYSLFYLFSASFGGGARPGQKLFSLFTAPKKGPESSPAEVNTPSTSCSTAVPKESEYQPIVPVDDRTDHLAATTIVFATELNLSFSATPRLIAYAKEMARDPLALEKLSMERQTHSYKLRFGVGPTFVQGIINDVGSSFFNLNLDEAMNNCHEKVLSVLIAYWSAAHNRVVLQHLGSVSLVKVDSASVVRALCTLLEKERKLKWEKCLSILMDSCNVMRGKKAGVETVIRQNHAKNLLDIDGDCCHHVHNAAKAFSAQLGGTVEQVFDDIYTDFKHSPAFQRALRGICELLDIKYTMPMRFLRHRWLSIMDLCEDTLRMLKPLTVLYYAFLPPSDKTVYHSVVLDILQKTTAETREEIRRIRASVTTISLTPQGRERKNRIVKKLFYTQTDTNLLLKFISSTMVDLKQFILIFQKKDPHIQRLHTELMNLIRSYLLIFVDARKIEPFTVETFTALNLEDKSNLLPIADLYIGTAKTLLKKCSAEAATLFRECALRAYVACGSKLLEKMPIRNEFLINVSGLDPLNILSSDSTSSCIAKVQKLRDMLPISAEERQSDLAKNQQMTDEDIDDLESERDAEYCKEVKNVLTSVKLPAFKNGDRVDLWWAAVLDSFPELKHLPKV